MLADIRVSPLLSHDYIELITLLMFVVGMVAGGKLRSVFREDN